MRLTGLRVDMTALNAWDRTPAFRATEGATFGRMGNPWAIYPPPCRSLRDNAKAWILTQAWLYRSGIVLPWWLAAVARSEDSTKAPGRVVAIFCDLIRREVAWRRGKGEPFPAAVRTMASAPYPLFRAALQLHRMTR